MSLPAFDLFTRLIAKARTDTDGFHRLRIQAASRRMFMLASLSPHFRTEARRELSSTFGRPRICENSNRRFATSDNKQADTAIAHRSPKHTKWR